MWRRTELTFTSDAHVDRALPFTDGRCTLAVRWKSDTEKAYHAHIYRIPGNSEMSASLCILRCEWKGWCVICAAAHTFLQKERKRKMGIKKRVKKKKNATKLWRCKKIHSLHIKLSMYSRHVPRICHIGSCLYDRSNPVPDHSNCCYKSTNWNSCVKLRTFSPHTMCDLAS